MEEGGKVKTTMNKKKNLLGKKLEICKKKLSCDVFFLSFFRKVTQEAKMNQKELE